MRCSGLKPASLYAGGGGGAFDNKGDVSGGSCFLYKVKGPGFQRVKTIVVK